MFSLKSKLAAGILGLLIIGSISACGPSTEISSRSNYPIDTTFADFYREVGGNSTLGPAISSVFTNEGLTYQYVVSALMVYDPNQVALKRFSFSPLASVEWHINGVIEPAPEDSNIPYVNGHQVWEEVVPFYDQYGADLLGSPLTGVTANDAKQRYEQYFEGLGFYRNYTDATGQVHLMPYGAWMCGSNCSFQVADATPPTSSYERDYSETEQLFLQASERLGYGFTGAPLAQPRLAADGFYEMVFENVTLYNDPTSGEQIKLRPLPTLLGIKVDKPEIDQKTEGFAFYPLEGNLGFSIPTRFVDYLSKHGGLETSGVPIAQSHNLSDGGTSQCFTNLCLEYHPNAPQELKIRPHALGAEYLSLGENVSAPGTPFTGALQINAWEDYPLIPSGEVQGINIEATKDNAPVSGIRLSLVVTQPNGITKTYALTPTDQAGKSHIDLDPINGPNGAIVQYEICVLSEDAPQICFSRSYTIWE